MVRPSFLRNIDDEALYKQLQVMLNTMPELQAEPNDETRRWLGRLIALVEETGAVSDVVELRRRMSQLNEPLMRDHVIAGIRDILFRALTWAELRAPSGAQGAFIPAGDVFDAYAAVAKIMVEAKKEVLLVDPYMDPSVFDFALLAPEGVLIRLLADEASVKKPLFVAVPRWVAQHEALRPLEARLAPHRSLHDRSIQIDRERAWISTQSFNALAQRSPASLSRLDGDAGGLKIEAYEAIWAESKPID